MFNLHCFQTYGMMKYYIKPTLSFKHKNMEPVMMFVPFSFREGSEHAIEVPTLLTTFRDGPPFLKSIKLPRQVVTVKSPKTPQIILAS